jgi:hypothetical protein
MKVMADKDDLHIWNFEPPPKCNKRKQKKVRNGGGGVPFLVFFATIGE